MLKTFFDPFLFSYTPKKNKTVCLLILLCLLCLINIKFLYDNFFLQKKKQQLCNASTCVNFPVTDFHNNYFHKLNFTVRAYIEWKYIIHSVHMECLTSTKTKIAQFYGTIHLLLFTHWTCFSHFFFFYGLRKMER